MVSACKKDGVDFPYSFTEFADSVDEDVLLSWRAAQDEAQRLLSEDMGGDSDGSKKKPR